MNQQLPNATVQLLIGQARPFGPNGEPSAIDKQHVALAVLPPSWRQLAEQRLQSRQVEDWSRRLNAPLAGAQTKA